MPAVLVDEAVRFGDTNSAAIYPSAVAIGDVVWAQHRDLRGYLRIDTTDDTWTEVQHPSAVAGEVSAERSFVMGNGKAYGTGGGSARPVSILNPTSGVMSMSTGVAMDATATAVPVGAFLYGFPFTRSAAITRLDTSNDTVSTVATSGSFPGALTGAAVAAGGAIYVAPGPGSSGVYRLNVATGAFTATTGPSAIGAQRRGHLMPNGRIYFLPLSNVRPIIKVNPTTDTHSVIAGSGLQGTWSIAVGDEIYAWSGSASSNSPLWRLDTTTDTVTNYATIGNHREAGVAAGNVLYLLDGEGPAITIDKVNLDTAAVTTITATTTAADRYRRGVLAPNGCVYAPPYTVDAASTTSILKIGTALIRLRSRQRRFFGTFGR